ncbi:MAG TPA: phage baseplate assembly protein V [Planctomycetota bacterium]|nr:phage baseplate assembly protein V [Planctomycetota bacterium]
MSSVITLPELRIHIGGSALSVRDAAALSEVRVRARLSLPAQCELVFRNPGTEDGQVRASRPGDALEIRVAGEQQPLFEGEVTAVDLCYGPRNDLSLRIRGYDLLHRLRKRQKVRVHVQVSAQDLARELVSDLGLAVEAEESGPVHDRLYQVGSTDLLLLQTTAGKAGLYFTHGGDALHLFTLEGLGDPVRLHLGKTLLEARLEMNGDSAVRTVNTQGWDPTRGEARRGTASSPRSGRSADAEVDPSQVGGTGERIRVSLAVGSDRAADAVAQAELDREAAREVTFWGIAEGNPSFRPGTKVELAGIAPSFRGTYVLTSVDHVIDAEGGFLSELSTLPPVPVTASEATVTALGIVTRVDDPEKLGRVRAKLPGHGDLETGWIEVVVPGAGKSKGLVALPGIDDRVLLLFPGGDPAQALVIGGLYGADGPPDAGVEAGAIRRYTFSTPGGQCVRLDDAGRKIRLEDSTGSYIELGPERAVLHAAVDLTLEAPGRAIRVKSSTVDFEQG